MISKDRKRWRIASHVILSVCSALAALPFLLLVIASLTDDKAAMNNGYSYFPQKWSFGAYEYLFQDAGRYIRAYGRNVRIRRRRRKGKVCRLRLFFLWALNAECSR